MDVSNLEPDPYKTKIMFLNYTLKLISINVKDLQY